MDQPAEPTFEQAIARLEEIVGQLDVGELPLEQSLKLFEEGIALARGCSRQLSDAQGRLEMLAKKVDGSLEPEAFEV